MKQLIDSLGIKNIRAVITAKFLNKKTSDSHDKTVNITNIYIEKQTTNLCIKENLDKLDKNHA